MTSSVSFASLSPRSVGSQKFFFVFADLLVDPVYTRVGLGKDCQTQALSSASPPCGISSAIFFYAYLPRKLRPPDDDLEMKGATARFKSFRGASCGSRMPLFGESCRSTRPEFLPSYLLLRAGVQDFH